MRSLRLGCALTALATSLFATSANAQSSGSIEVLDDEIVVTGARDTDGVEGIVIPETSKARAVLTDEIISRQTPGQSILDTINLVPGVSFQNNDGYGSSGGTLSIRGFDASRVSLTWDGFPLNDTGNYALYSNQQLDNELIGAVNVNLGTTDVDSPTASAAGGTVNYVTREPQDEMGATLAASYGDFDYHRVYGSFDTGEFTSFGTKAFVTASVQRYDNPFNDIGKIYKQQYNGRIYQPLGAGGDFLSLAGHYNQNRNNFFGSLPLRIDTVLANGQPRRAGPDANLNRFPLTRDEREYSIGPCTTDAPQAGVADAPNACGSTFDERYNPSDTGNVRFNSRYSLTEQLIFTLDASYQYVLANGGGAVIGSEFGRDVNPTGTGTNGVGTCSATVTTGPGLSCQVGYISGLPYAGIDLNGDGDRLDTVRVSAPSNTNTNRYIGIANLIYEFNDDHRARVAYTYDRGRHRQTGEVGLLRTNGRPFDFFTLDNPVPASDGSDLQKRDRLSYAILHQVSGEYIGKFADEALTVNLGLRAPFFTRDLDQRCFTTSAGGFVDCFGDATTNATYQALNPNFAPPREVKYKYDKLLPSAGFTFDVTETVGVFGNYARGLSVPSTDNLYNFLFFTGTNAPDPVPETTDSFDLGVRYTSRTVQAQLAGWYTKFKNRTASAFDPELNLSVFRNLGEVDKYGFDGSVAIQPIPQAVLTVFGSYLKSEIKDDIQTGVVLGAPVFAETGGQRESGSPVYTFGGSIRGFLGPVEAGITAKRTGKRYVFDTNQPVLAFINGATVEVYPEATPAYTLVDLDARVSLADIGLERTYFQLNVTNLFDKLYVGGFTGGLNQTINRNATTGAITGYSAPPFVQIGAPRTISGSLVFAF